MNNESHIRMTAPASVYQQRRAKLASRLKRSIVIFAGRARGRQNHINLHPFRAGSSYLYFGGPPIEGAALLIEPGSNGQAGCTLFRTPTTLEDIVWTGAGPSDAEIAGAAGLAVNQLKSPEDLAGMVKGRDAVAIAPPCPPTTESVNKIGLKSAEKDELLAIIEMRLCKDEHELNAMRFAAKVGVEAHLAAMRATAPGRTEADVAAALFAVYAKHQCGVSFTPMANVHGDVLHSEGYRYTMRPGHLLLVDSGAEEPGGYASDITRTYPVTGEFTSIQRHLYDTALRAQRGAITACTAGRRYREVHEIAATAICEGLVSAELLRGDPKQLAERSAHTLFFTHGVGHLIGLDVHDTRDFGDDLSGYPEGRTRRTEFGNKFLRLDRDLQPGMTVTIEPGIYLVPAIWQMEEMVRPFADVVNRRAVDSLVQAEFGGIRIEDTICVREAGGPEVLTGALPTDANAVASLVGRG